jgi:DNA transformation protein and related proteins
MASKQSSVDFVVDQMSGAGTVTARKMFGEYGIYCDGKIVALFCDEQLFVKPTPAGKAFIGEVTEGCAYPGAKPSFLVSGEQWEDSEWLSALIKITAQALPQPKLKASKPKPARRKVAKKSSR